MGVVSMDPRQNLQRSRSHGLVVEEIEGLVRVYRDGHVERPQIVPNVSCSVASELGVVSKDVAIANSWARVYVPNGSHKLPLLFYFHGGGFCVGSPSWICYHNFLAKLASRANCVIVSPSYRLAPENRLPAAYDDGAAAVAWVKQQVSNGISTDQLWWLGRCDFSKIFVSGDSAGANIAYNVSARQSPDFTGRVKGVVLIQPFFGGEARTRSEMRAPQTAGSALTLSASDTYWRLALPAGANRDHPCCNPLAAKGGARVGDMRVLVCVSELDILKDRNLELCSALASAGKRVERVVYGGVGHGFQVLSNSQVSQIRTSEMMSHIKTFINQ